MHPTQRKILNLSSRVNLASLKLREIGEKVGEPHPQKIKHHLDQLFKKGILKENSEKNLITRVDQLNSTDDKFISLPIYGSANCGEPLILAENYLEGYLQVSKSYINSKKLSNLFVLKAVGNSMNQADIQGQKIENGDYLIIEKEYNEDLNGKYVLSVINGMANVKKLTIDSDKHRILLVSESTHNFAPIVIHENDYEDYLVCGKVTQVIKKP